MIGLHRAKLVRGEFGKLRPVWTLGSDRRDCERSWLGKPFEPAALIGTVARLIVPVADSRYGTPPRSRATGILPASDLDDARFMT
jgi:hypothetical protein